MKPSHATATRKHKSSRRPAWAVLAILLALSWVLSLSSIGTSALAEEPADTPTVEAPPPAEAPTETPTPPPTEAPTATEVLTDTLTPPVEMPAATEAPTATQIQRDPSEELPAKI